MRGVKTYVYMRVFLGYSVLLVMKFGHSPLEVWTLLQIYDLLPLLGFVLCFIWQLLSVVFGMK